MPENLTVRQKRFIDYYIETGNATEVSVQNAAGTTENSPVSQRILKLLADDLR